MGMYIVMNYCGSVDYELITSHGVNTQSNLAKTTSQLDLLLDFTQYYR